MHRLRRSRQEKARSDLTTADATAIITTDMACTPKRDERNESDLGPSLYGGAFAL